MRLSRYLKTCLAAAMIMVCIGCGAGKTQTGKFTEEQMEQFDQPQQDNLPAPTGGLTLSVGSETIPARQIAAEIMAIPEVGQRAMDRQGFYNFARPYAYNAVLQKVIDMLLYQKAKQTAPENIEDLLDKAVETETNRFVSAFGGNYAEAEKAIAAMGMNWKQYRAYQKKMILTQSYIAGELKEEVKIGRAELIDYYESLKESRFKKDGFVQFSLIDIDTSKHPGTDEQKSSLEITSEIFAKLSASEDFAELARQYSDGHRAQFGGLWTPVSEGSSLVAPYETLLERAKQMRPGEIAGPIESGEHIFIIRLEKKESDGCTPFEQVQAGLQAELELAHRRERYETLMDKLFDEANLKDKDMNDFVLFCIDKAYEQYILRQGR